MAKSQVTKQFGFKFLLKDSSIVTATAEEASPLHNPLFLLFTPLGTPGVPYFGTMSALKQALGDDAFDEDTSFTNHATIMANAAASRQAITVARMVPADANYASSVLEVTLTRTTDVVQYRKTLTGARQIDANGDYIPVTDANGATVTEPGWTITPRIRPLAEDEEYDELEPAIDEVNGVYTFPLRAVIAKGPGSRMNCYGFKEYWDNDFTESSKTTTNSLIYKFSVMYKDPITAIASAETTSTADTVVEFSYRDGAYDTSLEAYVDLEDVIMTQYGEGDTLEPFPFKIKTYGTNLETIMDYLITRADELTDIDPYLFNFMTAEDLDGNPYDHIVLGNTEVLNADVVNYLSGGTDGTMTFDSFDALCAEYLKGNTYPAILDKSRYPINHIWDSGFGMDTKESMIDFMSDSLRNDVTVMVSTHSSNLSKALTASQDVSRGTALRQKCLEYADSTYFGTPNTRGVIVMQSARRSTEGRYRKLVPALYDLLVKRCISDGLSAGNRRSGYTIEGNPNAVLDTLDITTLNHTPATDTLMQTYLNTGLNCVKYVDRNIVQWMALVNAYNIAGSVLSTLANSVDICYMSHIGRKVWTIYCGRSDLTVPQLGEKVKEETLRRINIAFNGTKKIVSFTVSQTTQQISKQSATFTMQIALNSGITEFDFVAEAIRDA